MGTSLSHQLLLLVVLAAPLGGRLRVAAAECDLPGWPSWQQVDLDADPKPKDLAVDSLKDYLAGLEQASRDFKCPQDWSGAGLEIKSACLNPDASGGQYAVSFAYTVKCTVEDGEGGLEASSPSQEVDLSGVVQGLLPAKTTAGVSGVRTLAAAPFAEEALVLAQSSDEPAASKRNLLMNFVGN